MNSINFGQSRRDGGFLANGHQRCCTWRGGEHDPALEESRERHDRVLSAIDDMGWSLRGIRRLRLRGDPERHSLDNMNPLRAKQFEDSRVANVFLAERGFICRDGVTFEIGARSIESGHPIRVRTHFRCPLIAVHAAVNEIIGIGGQFGQSKRLQDTRIVLIALAEQDHS
jgi:hypothetical protein